MIVLYYLTVTFLASLIAGAILLIRHLTISRVLRFLRLFED